MSRGSGVTEQGSKEVTDSQDWQINLFTAPEKFWRQCCPVLVETGGGSQPSPGTGAAVVHKAEPSEVRNQQGRVPAGLGVASACSQAEEAPP